MLKKVTEVIKERENFLQHLENDIIQHDQTIQTLTKEQKDIENLITNMKALKLYPEHDALIPLGSRIYMKGRIVHSGEYYVKRSAHPDSLVILQSADKIVERLEEDKQLKEEDIDKYEYAKFQLEERIKSLHGEDTFQADSSDLPKEIKSDKGVAVRMGDYYEILEFEM